MARPALALVKPLPVAPPPKPKRAALTPVAKKARRPALKPDPTHLLLLRLVDDRRQLQQAELRLNNQIKALARTQNRPAKKLKVLLQQLETDYDEAANEALRSAYTNLRTLRLAVERELIPIVRTLPQAAWAKTVKGFGDGVLFAELVAGSLGQDGLGLQAYRSPAKLWKRWGVGLVEGQAQRRTKNKRLAEAMGFSPRRRATLHVVGECLVRARGPYAKLYATRKVLELKKLPMKGPDGKRLKGRKGWAHKRALRYIEKRLLLELWRQWHGAKETTAK